MGLRGWRRATTTPGRAKASKASRTSQPSETSPAGQARGMYKTVSASVSPPRMTAVLAGVRRKGRALTARGRARLGRRFSSCCAMTLSSHVRSHHV
jgi:hypothetical protein